MLPIATLPRIAHRNRKARQLNWDQIEGDWKQFKGKVQQQWDKLTDDDVDVVNGKHVELLRVLQNRYGHDKERGERAINQWLDKIDVEMRAHVQLGF